MSSRVSALRMDALGLKTPQIQKYTVKCPNIGVINAHVQGTRTSNEVVVLTVHDLGCDHTMYMEFVGHPKMAAIRSRTVWVHVEVPGQGQDSPDLPADYQFPSMQQIGEDLIYVVDELKIKEVICFGEGAGANILARFAMAHGRRVLGVCLLHTTGTTAGLLESLKEKAVGWRLEGGMNPSSESYLLLHRFGTTKFSNSSDRQELKPIAEGFQDALRERMNPRNLRKFVEAFLKRTNIADSIRKLTCPILLVTGQQSIFHSTTRALHIAILRSCSDRTKVEFVEVAGVANVLEEKPDKLIECFQYFLQGLGLVSSVPMQNVSIPTRGRSLSMQDYDMPMRQRMLSAQLASTPLDSRSPPRSGSQMEPEEDVRLWAISEKSELLQTPELASH